MKIRKVQKLLWLLTNLHENNVDNQDSYDMCNGLRSWVKEQNYKLAFVLDNYNSSDQLQGKLIVAQGKFKHRVQSGNLNEFFYYVVFSGDTMFTDALRDSIKESFQHSLKDEQVMIMNVKEYAEECDLPLPLLLSDILKVSKKEIILLLQFF